jgi:uncharacterized membrane protein SpoIIM required for sporulation
MKEAQFINQRQGEWEAWDRWLSATKNKRKRDKKAKAKDNSAELPETDLAVDTLPSAFRRLCQDLSLSRDRNYSSTLVHALHDRVLAAHQRIYGARRRLAGHWLEFLVAGLPRLVREEKRYILVSAALFFLPLLIALLLLQWYPDGVYYLLSPHEVANFEEMYSPAAARLGRSRGASSELTMLAFYIAHNVRIDFQCFAGGIVFGLGSIFYLIFNGLMIGGTAGHLTQLGYIETFWGFVAGHSAPELIGVVLSGASGLKIGLALIAPGRRRRVDALKDAAQGAVRLLYGAAALTFSAAFIESLWSPNRALPFQVKIGVGVALWAIFLLYFLFAGRKLHAA